MSGIALRFSCKVQLTVFQTVPAAVGHSEQLAVLVSPQGRQLQPGSMVSPKIVWLTNPGKDLRIVVKACVQQAVDYEHNARRGRECGSLYNVALPVRAPAPTWLNSVAKYGLVDKPRNQPAHWGTASASSKRGIMSTMQEAGNVGSCTMFLSL
jgi:hypothetical protein